MDKTWYHVKTLNGVSEKAQPGSCVYGRHQGMRVERGGLFEVPVGSRQGRPGDLTRASVKGHVRGTQSY